MAATEAAKNGANNSQPSACPVKKQTNKKKHIKKKTFKCTNFRACRKTQHLVCLPHNTGSIKYSVFFPLSSTCALSAFARVEVQKSMGGKKEGEKESMRAKAERAAGKTA